MSEGRKTAISAVMFDGLTVSKSRLADNATHDLMELSFQKFDILSVCYYPTRKIELFYFFISGGCICAQVRCYSWPKMGKIPLWVYIYD